MCLGIDSRYHFMLRELRYRINVAKHEKEVYNLPVDLKKVKEDGAKEIVELYDLTPAEKKEFYEQLISINENL